MSDAIIDRPVLEMRSSYGTRVYFEESTHNRAIILTDTLAGDTANVGIYGKISRAETLGGN